MADRSLRQKRYRRRARLALLIAWVLGGGFALIVLGRVYEVYPEDDYCLWHPRRCEANKTFAARYFSGLLPVRRVLESREYFVPPYLFDGGSGLFDCIYAVVELGDDAPEEPTLLYRDGQNHPVGWPQPWVRLESLSESIKATYPPDAIILGCSVYWSAETNQRIWRALASPETWVLGGTGPGDFIYSKREGIAAMAAITD